MKRLLILLGFLAVFFPSLAAAQVTVSFSKSEMTVKQAFVEIEKQTGYSLAYNETLVNVGRKVTVPAGPHTLDSALKILLEGSDVEYAIVGNKIVIEPSKTGGRQESTYIIHVTDRLGEALPGVLVLIDGSKTPSVTDISGKVSVTGSRGTLLTFSCLGFKDTSVVLGTGLQINVVMEAEVIALEQLVFVGYGSRKKESLTGAISNIVDDEIVTTVHTSLSESLAGKISGFQVRQNSGEPGDYNTSINVRGFGAPLYVIDGVPSDLGAAEFQRISPSDIESISVIKDASAAIFGLRAANGVVLVKTKRGEAGRTRVNYSYTFGLETPTNMPRMCTRGEWATLRNEADINAGSSPYFTKEQLASQREGISTDWCSEVLKKFSTQQQHNLSVSGGNEKINYYSSLGYVGETGLLKTGDIDYDKFNFRTNVSAHLVGGLSFDANMSAMYDNKYAPSMGYYNVYYAAVTCLPDSTPFIGGNTDYPSWQTFLNPVVLADSERTGYVKTGNKQFNLSMSLNYDFQYVKGLHAKVTGNYQSYYTGVKTVSKSYKLYTYDSDLDEYSFVTKNSPSKITEQFTDRDMLTLQAQLRYDRTFGGDHKVEGTLVYEQHQAFSRYGDLTREYSFFTKDQVDMASLNNMKNGGMENQLASVSVIGRFNYDFRSRYLLEFSFREDGSYRYAPSHRWGFFPVVSAGWRISNEPFMKNVSWISELKLRGSIGLVGEDAGQPFQYISAYTLGNGAGYEFVNGEWTDGASSPAITNERLTWYVSNTKDIGLTAALFGHRLNMEVDFYQRDRSGLLTTRLTTLPNSFGATLPQENLNSDLVRGFDLSLGWKSSIGGFDYEVTGTFNYVRTMNKYIEEAEPVSSSSHWRGDTAWRFNDVLWGYNVIGQFQSQEEIDSAPIQGGVNGNTKILPGDYRYEDVNGDGVIDGNDTLPLFFNGTPKMYFGLTFRAAYKGFDASMVLQGAGLYTIRYSGVYAEALAYDLNTPAYFYDRWHQEDPYDASSAWIPGTWPATRLVANAGSNYYESRIWRRDASYLRLKSVELGYTWRNFRVFLSGHNLLTICDPFVKAFDPEKSEGANSMGFTYPVTRSFNMGINIQF